MYSPHSDLYKMIHTPGFIVFRVSVDGKEYLGRPISVGVDNFWQPGPNQSATFQIYRSMQDFMAGYIQSEIQVTSANTIGLEAIDAYGRESLDSILSACFEISEINPKADIGIIKRVIPDMLNRLAETLNEFEQLHNLIRYERAYYYIEDLALDCHRCRYDLSEVERADMVRNIKEKVRIAVTNLIEFATRAAA